MNQFTELRGAFPEAAENIGMIPKHMRNAVSNWILFGLEPGDFFRAVLANNLFRAVGHADAINGEQLAAWVTFLYNYTPGECHGSEDRVMRWSKRGGILGHKAGVAA